MGRVTLKLIDIYIGEYRFRAQLLTNGSSDTAEQFWSALPLEGWAVHDQWSGAIFRIEGFDLSHVSRGGSPVYFQHPGLVVLDQATDRLVTCYGQGRWQGAGGPLPAVPIAQIGGDPASLVEVGRALEFEGSKRVRVAPSSDHTSALDAPPIPMGRRIEIRLGNVTATARLLEEVAPDATNSFARALPLAGQATNTLSSGPLTRFWNPHGGNEGETPLETGSHDASQMILYPGEIYYLPNHPWRGFRIAAQHATIMKGPIGPGALRLIPLARFEGDWSAFRNQAERLIYEGAKEMSFQMLESD